VAAAVALRREISYSLRALYSTLEESGVNPLRAAEDYLRHA
jgi:hypothetical protein